MGNKCGSGQEVSQEEPKIIVYVKSAQGLPGVDWFPGVDRFLHFGVGADAGGDEFFKSQPKKNVMDPVWNEEFEVPANMPLKFTVFQADADGKTDAVACATLDLAASGGDQFNGELPLELDGKPTGGILTLKASSGDEYPADLSPEFKVTIDNPKKKALGLEVDNLDPAKLFVFNVKKSSVMDRYNEEQPENKIEAGCFITGVTVADDSKGDGKDSSSRGSQAMEKVLKKNPKQVSLVCKRANMFCVPLSLPEKGGIGVQTPTSPLGNSLLITEVKGNGAVEVWNDANPDQIIETWDRIVAIDGKSGKAAELTKLAKAAQKSANVVITIVRIVS
mmetsp:Transcript_59281/g.117473  ORF Transcript_59281/g.117473 Transcript_59281/m.117473 type:complete len:334 (-) Transcript_59281:39-1040(-)